MKLSSHLLHDRCIFYECACSWPACETCSLATRVIESQRCDSDAVRKSVTKFARIVPNFANLVPKFRSCCCQPSSRLNISEKHSLLVNYWSVRNACHEMNTRQLSERIRRWICRCDGTGKFIANCERRWSEREREQKNGKMTDLLNISKIQNICLLPEDLDKQEDPRTPTLRRVSYGIVLPTICCLGIIGNILNLVVLTRRNMRGTAYVYMRGEHHLSIVIRF